MNKRLAVLLCVVFSCGSALAQSGRHRAVSPGPRVEPTSEDLIANALAAGTINAEQALTYRVFAAFGDCRLPSKYAGNDRDVGSTYVLDDLRAAMSTLSPEAQETLRPYLKKPFEAGGWVDAQQAVCGSGKTGVSAIAQGITVFGGKIVINFLEENRNNATVVASYLERQFSIFTFLTDLMGEPPRYDANEPTELEIDMLGGRPHFNIAVKSSSDDCNHATSIIEMNSAADKDWVVFGVMLAILRTIPVATPCRYPEYRWLEIATAVWALDLTATDLEHQFAPRFLSSPERSLEHDDGKRPYGAYLLPFYVVHRFDDPVFVRNVWDNTKTMLSLDAVDAALAVEGGFKEQWPEFAAYNLNYQPPYAKYQEWDNLYAQARSDSDTLNAAPDKKDNLTMAPLAPLSAQYFHYFIDSSAHTLAFVNGINYKASIRVFDFTPDWGKGFALDNASKPRDGLKVQALLKINGAWEQTPRDWTQKPFVVFCRDFPAEHIDEAVLIISNSEYKKREPIRPEGLPPMIWVSNMACAGWTTEKATYRQTVGHPLRLSFSATFRRTTDLSNPADQPTLPAAGVGPIGILYAGAGEVSWSFDNTDGCTYSGNGKVPLALPVLLTFNIAPPEGTMHRGYTGVLKTSGETVHYTRQCGNHTPDPFDLILPGWSVGPPEDVRKVNADGVTIEGTNAVSMDRGTTDWKLTAIPP